MFCVCVWAHVCMYVCVCVPRNHFIFMSLLILILISIKYYDYYKEKKSRLYSFLYYNELKAFITSHVLGVTYSAIVLRGSCANFGV